MDYDRYDAFLHHIFKQTQGDAWFRPNEENLSAGVALRVSDDPPEFRVFPYENASLEPFEAAVKLLNPVVAVKVRSAAVHAALAEAQPDDTSIYVDMDTRIQILDTILALPHADKEQCAAFIRDERVLIVWSDTLDSIIPATADLEERLIKLLWRSRPNPRSTVTTTTTTGLSLVSAQSSVDGHSTSRGRSLISHGPSPAPSTEPEKKPEPPKKVTKRTWYGRKYEIEADPEGQRTAPRRTALYAPIYNGCAAGLAFVFVGNGIRVLLVEWAYDSDFIRFALCALLPLLFCISLFFTLQIIQNVTMAIGPIAHYHENSTYYSAIPPKPNKLVDNNLPHITIQMPVYKEGLEAVLAPSIESLKKAMQTYARQGGTSSILICDDGLRLLSPADRDERLVYYANHNIGWVARPPHGALPEGMTDTDSSNLNEKQTTRKERKALEADKFHRAGRFKKASNLNYGLALSLKTEKHLEALLAQQAVNGGPNVAAYRQQLAASDQSSVFGGMYGLQYASNKRGPNGSVYDFPPSGSNVAPGTGSEYTPNELDLEERALQMAIQETFEETGRKHKPWAANARATRLGSILLLVDSDTIVPSDCLRDAAREMKEDERVAVIQHESDVMQVAFHYFENGIAYFTRRINRCISMACANGEVAPFVGHNAFLRWSAVQDAAFIDPADGKQKFWSESNVSEDFDMALRLQLKGYLIRWATYSNGGFKEGVSLSVDDELNRWQKYAYGCSELLFNPFSQWLRKGPIAHQIHRFLWSPAPIHYKISMLAYMFSYYGIAASVTIGIINYVLLGFQLPVDGFYMRSFEVWLATTIVFFGSGNVGYTLLEYRLGHKELIAGLLENLKWVPFFFFFFGGLAIPVSQAILAHLFSYNITWSATIKEVERSNFFKEVPKIVKRFWFPLLCSFLLIVSMIVLSTPLVPYAWRIDGSAWAVIFPLGIVAGCHILFPIVLNPWLMIFSY